MRSLLKTAGKLTAQGRHFFEGHTNSKLPFLNECRDKIATASFTLSSIYLRSLPEQTLERIILNTCSLSPIQATMAHWADWSLHRQGFNGNLSKQPKFIFVKSEFRYLAEFYTKYLPRIHPHTRFILISGDSDETIPLQTDLRFPANNQEQLHLLRRLHDDPRLTRWFSQNIDFKWEKLHAIPLGYWEHGGTSLFRTLLKNPKTTPIENRKLKIFCAHRLRPGAQWEKRSQVTKMALKEWKEYVDYYDNVPDASFFATISRYPFVMCVGGGGLDPSPKAWTALMAGAIPIIETNATTEAYRDLPVIYIDSWQSLRLDRDTLMQWLEQHQRHFNNPVLRQETLRKLSMGYWLAKIKSEPTNGATREG